MKRSFGFSIDPEYCKSLSILSLVMFMITLIYEGVFLLQSETVPAFVESVNEYNNGSKTISVRPRGSGSSSITLLKFHRPDRSVGTFRIFEGGPPDFKVGEQVPIRVIWGEPESIKVATISRLFSYSIFGFFSFVIFFSLWHFTRES